MSRNVSGTAGFEETKGEAESEKLLAQKQKKSKREIQQEEEIE